jgi:hypothetical protein
MTNLGIVRVKRGRDESEQCLVQIVPFGIHLVNQPHFPGSRPVLDVLFTLDCQPDVIELFVIDQPFQSVSFCEAVGDSIAMLEHTSRQIIRDAGIENAVAPIRHEINPAPRHVDIETRRGWPDKPGHDEWAKQQA